MACQNEAPAPKAIYSGKSQCFPLAFENPQQPTALLNTESKLYNMTTTSSKQTLQSIMANAAAHAPAITLTPVIDNFSEQTLVAVFHVGLRKESEGESAYSPERVKSTKGLEMSTSTSMFESGCSELFSGKGAENL